MVVDTQSSAKSSNRTAGEVLLPHQLLKQGDELRQCSRLRHMIIRSTVLVHVPKLRPKQRTEVPEQRELSPRPRTRNSWRRWTNTGGSDRRRGSSSQSRWRTSRAISDISSETEGTKRRPSLAWRELPLRMTRHGWRNDACALRRTFSRRSGVQH